MQVPHEKPWYSLHGFLTYVARQRDKIPRRFRRTRAGVGDDGAHRRLEPTTAPPPSFREAIGDDKSVTNGQDIAASRPLDSNTLGTAETISPNQLPSRVSKAPPLGSHVKRPASHVKRPASNGESRRGIAFMDGSTLRERSEEHPLIVAENDQGLASETAGGKRKAQSEFQTQRVSGLGMAHEEPRPPEYSSSASWETDETSHGSQPSPATKDCVDSAEFASSAIMVQCPTGRHESVKLFYDTGCADNLASRKFIDKYGFKERPLLKDDLKVYETPAGVSFIPSRYVEIELRDTEHGIEDFTKTSFNVADAMDEIGLLAGRKFMIKHGVSLSAKEGPGAYVLISKKLSEGKQRSFVWLNKMSDMIHQMTREGKSFCWTRLQQLWKGQRRIRHPALARQPCQPPRVKPSTLLHLLTLVLRLARRTALLESERENVVEIEF